LALIVTERLLAIEQLEEDHTNAPNVYLVRYLGRILLETLWSLIPIGANALGGELNFLVTFIDYLAEAEICNFDLSIMKYDVLRLQVIMNDLLFIFI
jgi:hypothetical protein